MQIRKEFCLPPVANFPWKEVGLTLYYKTNIEGEFDAVHATREVVGEARTRLGIGADLLLDPDSFGRVKEEMWKMANEEQRPGWEPARHSVFMEK
ncbi:hypothetical protein M1403_00070 [Patescibacteria group bacterium]|nr:hypothetical protein [Patescibacteria group bacterium]